MIFGGEAFLSLFVMQKVPQLQGSRIRGKPYIRQWTHAAAVLSLSEALERDSVILFEISYSHRFRAWSSRDTRLRSGFRAGSRLS